MSEVTDSPAEPGGEIMTAGLPATGTPALSARTVTNGTATASLVIGDNDPRAQGSYSDSGVIKP
jgi:hypothetical protein